MSSNNYLRLVPVPDTESQQEPSDDVLMARAHAGVPGAFDALVLRHQARMLRVAFRLSGNASTAADSVQNTFVELFCALASYKACGKFRPFLYRLLLNQCRRVWRRDRTARRVLRVISENPSVEARRTPSDGWHFDVEHALAKLPEHQRSTVLLQYAGGLTHQEIAETLGVPAGTVKSRISDAMARMRATMEAP